MLHTGTQPVWKEDEPFETGLGRKDVESPSLDMDPTEFRELIFNTFPKLQEGGGYQFCRCQPAQLQRAV